MTRKRLRPHQRRALRFARERGDRVGLFMAPGTGKTVTAIRWAGPGPVLVVCRRDDYLTWRKELYEEDLPRPFEFHDGKTRMKHHPHWCLVTYGLMRNPDVAKQIKSVPWRTVIADESHEMRGHKSQQTKATIRATRHVPRRMALTGTFMGNSLDDVFPQALFIDDGDTFGSSWWKFMKSYHTQMPYGGWVPKPGARDRIVNRLRRIAYVVDEDDVLRLPPRRRLVRGAPMSGTQRKHFESVLERWQADLRSGDVIEIDVAAARTSVLQQIASGFLYLNQEDPNPRKTKWLGCPKFQLMLRHLDQRIKDGKQTVVWAAFSAEVQRIAHHLRKDCVVLSSNSAKDRERAREDFSAGAPVFVAQADRGVGMNELVVSDTAFYLSNSPRVISRNQSERRTRRIGSEHHTHCTYVDYVTEGTLDRMHLEALREKKDAVQYITNRLRTESGPLF